MAKKLVDVASDAGADAVKFQKRKLDKTYINEIVTDPTIAEMGVEYTVSNLKDVKLTDDEFRELKAYTKHQDVDFLCSPWDEESVDFLEEFDLPFYKIGSPDMTNFVLLERVMETGRPLLVSTGMSEEDEIDRTTDFLDENDAEYALMHCRSTYPAPFHNLNLAYIERMKDRYAVPVGYSGHERGIAVSEAAATMGASIIERHITIDRTLEGPDHAASLEPTGIKKLVRNIRNIEESRGTATRYMTRGEYNNRVALAKSLAVTENISEGKTMTRAKLTAKSPAKGISPQELYEVTGTEAARDIPADTILQWRDIEKRVCEEYDISLNNWGIVVRHSDIDNDRWGDPDVYEFRINGSDIDVDFGNKFGGEKFEAELGIHAPEQMGHKLVDLSARSEDRRRQGVDVIQRVINIVRDEIAPHFPATQEPKIVVHPGGITTDHMDRDYVPEMNKALKRSVSELDDEGIEILLENMPPLPWIHGGQQYHNNFMDAEEIAGYCDRTGQRICYDVSHAKLWCNYAGQSLREHAMTLRPYTSYLHVADAAGIDGEGLQIGDGEIDFDMIGNVFADFDGPIVTEIWRGHERGGAGFKKAAKRLQSYFQ